VTGLMLYSAGTLLFWPAAVVGKFAFFLCALFVIAAGWPSWKPAPTRSSRSWGPASSERRLNFSQAFNPLGAITGAMVGTVFIFSGVELKGNQVQALKLAGRYQAYLQHETMRVITPYLVLAA